MTKSSPSPSSNYVAFYRVEFNDAPSLGVPHVHYFTSLSAIFDNFSPEQIGCRLENLYNLKVSDGSVYMGRLCTIVRCFAYRKAHKGARVAKTSNGGTTAHPKQNNATQPEFDKNNSN